MDNGKDIEVEVMGDEYGNVVDLYEGDCSVERGDEKVVEVGR